MSIGYKIFYVIHKDREMINFDLFKTDKILF